MKNRDENNSIKGVTIFITLLTLVLLVVSAALVFIAIAGLLRGDWIMCIVAAVLAILVITAISFVLRIPVNLEKQAKEQNKARKSAS